MFKELLDRIKSIITGRVTLLFVVCCVLGVVLVYRCFDLQIVQGQAYLDEFILQTEKSRDISSSRGNIFDKNGNLLAYNELAYSVKIEDNFESGRNKNALLNETIFTLIQLIEKNGDKVNTDFKIVLNENGEFEYSVSGTAKLRFLADVYGYTTIDKLKETEKNVSAKGLMEFLSKKENGGFAIGDYEVEDDTKSDFIPGKGYSKEDWLKMVTIRYSMRLTSYRKYIGTIVATNVNERTVAVIMENSDKLPGITIVEDTVRKYVDSKYFAHVLGYTGKISSDELTDLNAKVAQEGGAENTYNINDMVGKGGIEAYFETTLQGTKGYEKVVVDTTGKVMKIIERREAEAGDDIYLTIDKDLTIAVYNIVEQKLAGLLASKIRNVKEYKPAENASSSDIIIPIYDVYYALINNNIIDINHFTHEDAGEYEKKLQGRFEEYRESIYNRLRNELMTDMKPYKKLTKEYQVYQSNIVSLLKENGVIISSMVDSNDATQRAWAVDEVISLQEYLKYCISVNWIDVTKLDINSKYSDSEEIYAKLVDYIIEMVDNNREFQKKFYKYMLLNNKINGKDVCMVLCEQNQVEIPEDEELNLSKGRLSSYQFMMNRINGLDITPGQLALDPCNASVVITDVNTGDVICMVSYPGFDNNKMANSIDAAYYAKMSVDKANSWYNFATQYTGAPGSTFKIVSATAGLMENVTGLNEKINCQGTFKTITPSPRCWKRSGHGIETVTSAIRDSCNYYFYELGYRLSTRGGGGYNEEAGLNALYQYADMYGLTEKSGVEINEASPTVSNEDPVRSAIGQGRNSFSTVGIARYTTTIANGGTCFNLTLLDKITDARGNLILDNQAVVRNEIEMPRSYWDAIHKGMRQVVQNKTYFSDLSVNVAGKTGTAEQTSSRPSHALFISYAPYENPEISVTTRIPFGYSSDYAAQTTRDIIKYYYGLEEEEELITGEADAPDGGISNET